MNMKSTLNKLLMIAAGLFAVSAPTYAHWGAGTPWTFVGQSNECRHNSSSSTTHRRVRLQTLDVGFWFCNEITGQCFWSSFGHDAVVTNITPKNNPTKTNSGRADIILSGYDDAVPFGSFLPYFDFINDLPRNSAKNLSTSQGKLFSNLCAACQTSDAML